MSQKYSVIVSDLGNVLLPFDYKNIIQRLDGVEKGLGEKFVLFYKENYDIHRRYERGDMSSEEFTDVMLDVIDHRVSREEFFDIYSKIFTVNTDLVAVLPVLKKQYRLVLLSNTNGIHQRYGWQDNEFLKNFDKLVLSHEVGAVKPEEKIYRAVEEFTQAPSAEHFYIDDIADYVAGARKIGWDAVQFVGNKDLFAEFDRRGIKWNDGVPE